MSERFEDQAAGRRSAAEIGLAEHAALLAEILAGREDGRFDTNAGCADDDLEYAIEEVRDAIPGALAALAEKRRPPI